MYQQEPARGDFDGLRMIRPEDLEALMQGSKRPASRDTDRPLPDAAAEGQSSPAPRKGQTVGARIRISDEDLAFLASYAKAIDLEVPDVLAKWFHEHEKQMVEVVVRRAQERQARIDAATQKGGRK